MVGLRERDVCECLSGDERGDRSTFMERRHSRKDALAHTAEDKATRQSNWTSMTELQVDKGCTHRLDSLGAVLVLGCRIFLG